jgi:hypothetical protein
MAVRWSGPLASYGQLTRDRRLFEPKSLTADSTPMPLRYCPVEKPAHGDAVDVGSIDSIDIESNPIMGSGRFLSPSIEPLAMPAMEKARMGINMPSLDLSRNDFRARIGEDADGKYLAYTRATIIAATLVSLAAFGNQRFTVSDDFQALTAAAWTFEEYDEEEDALVAAVNASGWEGLPIAQRDAVFKADDAILRIAAWAGIGSDHFDAAKMKRAFLWMDTSKDPADYTAYRLPVGDIVGGKLTIIYHAVYAGAALINGAHGGLPAISSEEKARLVPVINNIYKAMSEAFNDDLNPPWNQGATTRALTMDEKVVKIEGDRLINGLVAGSGPLAPPSDWFADPQLPGPTRLKITDEGRVYGHLGQLGVCHTGYANVCITLPDSKTDYARFHQGDVVCADGERIAVGKITLGTGHANTSLAMRAAVEHYDNTGTVVAVVRAGRDSYGDWVAGSLVAGLDPTRVAELRRSPLSGDWRYCPEVGNLELIAALAVNSPGFPVTEVKDGVQVSMVAAGMIDDEGDGLRNHWSSHTDELGGSPEISATLIADAVQVEVEQSEPVTVAAVADEVQARERRTERLAAILAAQQMGRVERLARIIGE